MEAVCENLGYFESAPLEDIRPSSLPDSRTCPFDRTKPYMSFQQDNRRYALSGVIQDFLTTRSVLSEATATYST
jgi:hypothetical protein